MNRGTASLLTCPECSGGKLHLEEYLLSDGDSDQVIDGRLVCADCGNWYRIEKGIVDLLPFRIKRLNYDRFVLRDVRFAEKYGLTLPAPAESENGVPLNKTKPMGAFEDVANYENNVVNNRFYKALDQTAFLEWMTQNLKAGDLVLDMGCGSGRQCIPMAEAGIRALGLDVEKICSCWLPKRLGRNRWAGW